ncbi:MAG: CorA family divalent cation transporter [Oscillospiraceae bacterium]
MTVFLDGKHVDTLQSMPADEIQALIFMEPAESSSVLKKLRLGKLRLPPPTEDDTSSRFESHNGFDRIFLNIPCKNDAAQSLQHVDIYLTGNDLIFIGKSFAVTQNLISLLQQNKANTPMLPEHVLYLFFNLLTEKDGAHLQDVEEQIAALEDDVAEGADIDYSAKISALRKDLLRWKRYYESLFDLLTDLEENQNHFISKPQAKYFRILTNRADRLSRAVLNLRDYVTQVREAYQAQMDISLNQTMKLFTVLTAIFSPLTLIVGWYGMNLAMPEFKIPFAYPVVIGVCVAVVGWCIYYFKKHKWF